MSITFDVFAEGLVFPESPRWHRGELWLCDIHAHDVVRYGIDGTERGRLHFTDRVCGLGFAPDGALMVVSMLDRRVLAVRDGRSSVLADLSQHSDTFLNDMVVDQFGRAYVGARNRPVSSGADVVVLARPDGSTEVVADGMWSPNGSAITADGRTLVIAETSEARLTAFDVDADGGLSNRRTLAMVEGSHPDGICLDAADGVWFGSPLTQELVRVDAAGAVTRRVPTPGWWAVACTLGGPDGRTLYCVVGRNSIENLRRLGDDRAADGTSDATGAVWTMQVDIPASEG
jgi:sugar lactone lactonase YvrE